MGLTDSSRVTPFVRSFVSFAQGRQTFEDNAMRGGEKEASEGGRTDRKIDKRHFRGGGNFETLIASDTPFCLATVLTASSAHFLVSSPLSYSVGAAEATNRRIERGAARLVIGPSLIKLHAARGVTALVTRRDGSRPLERVI